MPYTLCITSTTRYIVDEHSSVGRYQTYQPYQTDVSETYKQTNYNSVAEPESQYVPRSTYAARSSYTSQSPYIPQRSYTPQSNYNNPPSAYNSNDSYTTPNYDTSQNPYPLDTSYTQSDAYDTESSGTHGDYYNPQDSYAADRNSVQNHYYTQRERFPLQHTYILEESETTSDVQPGSEAALESTTHQLFGSQPTKAVLDSDVSHDTDDSGENSSMEAHGKLGDKTRLAETKKAKPGYETYLPWSIVTCLCCCICLGVPALIFSSMVTQDNRQGE